MGVNIVNPQKNCLDGIEHLHSLEKLNVNTTGRTAYDKNPASITDKDISKISKVKSLKSLKLNNQSSITWVYLETLENLEEIQITRNTSLNEVIGLDKLYKVKDFVEYGNKELYKIENIDTLINNNELDNIEIDLLHYDEIIKVASKINQMPNCGFLETLSSGKTINYSYYQVQLFHKKCLEIANKAKSISRDKQAQIIFVENYLAQNMTYDYEGRNSEKRAHFEDGKQKGKKYGVNSAYNGIMFGSAVCEGYTRSMQYILKLMDIQTKDVYCISGEDKIQINESYHNAVSLPNDGYHSIIRIDDDNSIYYCDPCWDSCKYHSNDKSLPFCLLTKKEMSKTHTMSFEEDNVIYDIPFPRDYVLKTLQYIDLYKNEEEQEIGRSR